MHYGLHMSTFNFRASIIGFTLLTLAVFAGLTLGFHGLQTLFDWRPWVGAVLAALVLGLTVTVALDKPLDRG